MGGGQAEMSDVIIFKDHFLRLKFSSGMFQVDRRLGNSFPAVIHFIFLFYFGWGPFS